jgi:hypothetical protein
MTRELLVTHQIKKEGRENEAKKKLPKNSLLKLAAISSEGERII